MNVRDVKAIVGDTPHMSLGQAKKMTRFIRDHRPVDILELGFKHGVSTCFMAAALGELGRGSMVTIDLESARANTPNIETLLDQVGERTRVQVYYEPTSYTWRLMKMLEDDASPRFDLCYIDGAHSWAVDALAFFLADRLLRPGGWIILDDLHWTYASSPTLKELPLVKAMPTDERETPQVERIFELLVKTHPGYHNARVEDDWGFAQKREVELHRRASEGLKAPLQRVVSGLRDIRELLRSRLNMG